MADTRLYIQAQKFSLSVGISTSDTSITLQSFNFPDGTAIASGDLGTVNYGTLEPGTSREEQISFTGITTNADNSVTLTGVTRGLGFGATDTYSEQSDLKVQHGAGATFILSNTAAFYDNFVNKGNDETIEGTLSVPVPTDDSHAATKKYVDDNVSGGAVSNNRIVQAGTAGESVAAGDLVYFDDTDNEWKKTDGTDATTLNNVLLGIAQGTGSNGAAISGGVLTYGLDSNQTGLTVGAKVYAGDTAGAIVESAGTVEKVIGWTKSATEIYFDPNVDTVPTADEKDAMSGGGDFGTPTSSNKFLTEEAVSSNSIFTPPTVETFTTSGTWTKDAGLKYVVVELVGGGGGGGDDPGDNADGGCAGGFSRKTILASNLGATETVTIGAGGLHESGQGGGTTSFGTHCQATGGAYSNDTNGGGVGSGGDLNFKGEAGNRGSDSTSSSGSEYGKGGPSYFGKGSNSGAGGGQNADGEAGIVIVTKYYS